MKMTRISALASAISVSLLLVGCGSDSDNDNSSSNNQGNPPEGVNVTADNTFQTYTFSYSLGGDDTDSNFFTQTLLNVRNGNLLNSTDTVIVRGDGSFEEEEEDDTDVTFLGNNFEYILDSSNDSLGTPFYGLTTDYFTITDDTSKQSVSFKVDYERINLSGRPTDSEENETPLSLFTNNNNLIFPSGAACWIQVGSSWSESIYLVDFDDASEFNSVEDWRNAGFGPLYSGLESENVGRNNRYAASRLTDDGSDSLYPGLIANNNKFYEGTYFPKDVIRDSSDDCDHYNKVAADFISERIKINLDR